MDRLGAGSDARLEGGIASITRESAAPIGGRPKIACARGKELVQLDKPIQDTVDGAFAALRTILMKDRDIAAMAAQPVIDDNGEELSLKMKVNLQSGEVRIWKDKKVRGVVHLRNLHLDLSQMSAAEVLLCQLGGMISQADGQGAISTWNRTVAQGAQGEVATLPERSEKVFGRGDVAPVHRDELNVQMKRDLTKCETKDHAKRYLQMMRYGAVMMHEYKAGMELLMARYQGEKAALKQEKAVSGGRNPVEDLRLEQKITKLGNKIALIDKKLRDIDNLDGYAFSKMALHASKYEPSELVSDAKREEIAKACLDEIEEETEPKGVKARVRGFFNKPITRSEEATAYAKAVARGLLSDRQREGNEEFKGNIPLISHLVFNPAMQFLENSDRAYYGEMVSPFFSDLGEECEAFLSDVHSQAMMTAYAATKDIEASFDQPFRYCGGDGFKIGDKGIETAQGVSAGGGFEQLADLPPWSLAALEQDLTFSQDGKMPGRYATIRFGAGNATSLSKQICQLRYDYYLTTLPAGNTQSNEERWAGFMRSDRKIDYAQAKDKLVTDWTTRIRIRDKEKRDCDVPPLRYYNSAATALETIGDKDTPVIMHHSRLDRLKEGEQWLNPFTGQPITYSEVASQSREMNQLNAIEKMLEDLERIAPPTVITDGTPLVVPPAQPATLPGGGSTASIDSETMAGAVEALLENGENSDEGILDYAQS